jgi:arylsulfatase A-like enzyme
LYWHYPNEWGPDGPGIGSFSAVREGDWKLIYFHFDQHFELYHLKEDISELQNLVSIQKEKVNQLVNLLDTYLQGVKAQMPFYKNSKQVIPYPLKALKAQNDEG